MPGSVRFLEGPDDGHEQDSVLDNGSLRALLRANSWVQLATTPTACHHIYATLRETKCLALSYSKFFSLRSSRQGM